MPGVPPGQWSGSDATNALHESIARLSAKAAKQTAWLVGLTLMIAVLTGVLVWTRLREAHRGQVAGGVRVLWAEEERTDTNNRSETSWRIESVHSRGEAFCDADIDTLTKLREIHSRPSRLYPNPNVKEVQTAPGMVIVIFKDPRGECGGQIRTRFLCLPDTVDPRGPKGK